MPDVIDQLRRYGDAVEEAVPAAGPPRAQDRRPWLLAAAILAVVACMGAAVMVLQADGDRSGPIVDVVDDPPAPTGWQSLDPGPLPPRDDAAVVWTGEELVVWGGYQLRDGYRVRSDGAAVDPSTGRWRRLTEAPIPGGPATGVWTGSEVLVWTIVAEPSGSNDRWFGAAWDPATDTWRPLADAPRRTVDGAVAPLWTGQEMVDVALGAAYDPAGDRWRSLPARPVLGPVVASAWTGGEVITLVRNRSAPEYPPGDAVALAYDPGADTWEALPPTGVGENDDALTWDGERLVALDYSMQAATYRPGDDAWQPLPPLPMRFYECSPRLAPVGGHVFAQHCSGQAILTEDREWAIAPPAPQPWGVLVPAGDVLLAFSSSDYYGDPPGSSLHAYRPPTVGDGDLALERTIPVGTVRLDLPEGARLTDTSLAQEAGGLVTEIGFELTLADGTACSLRSTYAGIRSEIRIRNDASDADAEISRVPLAGVDVDRDRALVARFAAGSYDEQAHILLEESTSDVLDIACPDLATAEALLSRIHR